MSASPMDQVGSKISSSNLAAPRSGLVEQEGELFVDFLLTSSAPPSTPAPYVQHDTTNRSAVTDETSQHDDQTDDAEEGAQADEAKGDQACDETDDCDLTSKQLSSVVAPTLQPPTTKPILAPLSPRVEQISDEGLAAGSNSQTDKVARKKVKPVSALKQNKVATSERPSADATTTQTAKASLEARDKANANVAPKDNEASAVDQKHVNHAGASDSHDASTRHKASRERASQQQSDAQRKTNKIEKSKRSELPRATADKLDGASAGAPVDHAASNNSPRRGSKANRRDVSAPAAIAKANATSSPRPEPIATTPTIAASTVQDATPTINDVTSNVPSTTATPPPTSAPATASSTPRIGEHLFQRTGKRTVEAPNLTPGEQARLVQRVSRAIEAARSRDGHVRLRLSPPELGSLRLEVRVDQGVLSARIEAESQSTKSILVDSLPALRDRLAEQGIRVEQFQVDVPDRRDQPTPHDTPYQQHQSPAERRDAPAPRPAVQSSTSTKTDDESPTNRTDDQINVIV